MFSVRCERTSGASPYFYRDYEEPLSGLEWGQRVQDREPFCGRTSLLNPSYIFFADEMRHDNGEPVEAYRVDYLDKVCQYINFPAIFTPMLRTEIKVNLYKLSPV